MNTTNLYDRVCLTAPMDQESFLSYLNYSVAELCAIYGEDKVMDGPFRIVERVGQPVGVKEPYGPAVLDDIFYLHTRDQRHKTDFTAHARYAYEALWHGKNRGRRIRREVW